MTTKNQTPKVATTKISTPAPSDKAQPHLEQSSKASQPNEGTASAATTPPEPAKPFLPSTPVGVKAGDLTLKVDRAPATPASAPEKIPAVSENVVDPQADVQSQPSEDQPASMRKRHLADPDLVALVKDLYPQYAHDQGFIGVWEDTSSTYQRATVNFVRNILIEAEKRDIITRN